MTSIQAIFHMGLCKLKLELVFKHEKSMVQRAVQAAHSFEGNIVSLTSGWCWDVCFTGKHYKGQKQ